MRKITFLILFIPFLCFSQQKAFPSAYGGGAYATGGRGGNVYHVTNLSDNGNVGSFRWAIGQARPATIVFDVSGTIELQNQLNIEGKDLTIAGQTAPVGGITFTFANPTQNFQLIGRPSGNSQGVENIIIRYIRIRYKKENNETGLGIYGNTNVSRNIILDHVSISYAGWTGLGVRGNTSHNITFQNGLIAECKTGAIFGDSNTEENSYDNSFHGNFFYNTSHRFPNPNSIGRVDVINNVIQNYAFRQMSNTHSPQLNHINNYTATGDDTNIGFSQMNRDFDRGNNQIYTSGNIIDNGIFENPNADNKLIWSKWNAGSETQYLPANNFRASQWPLIGAPYPIITAIEAYNDVIINQDKGASKSLNADGTVSDSRDANDRAYFAKTAEGEGAYEPYTTGNNGNDRSFFFEQRYFNFLASISATPINTRPNNFYGNNPHIPEVWFATKVPAGQNHNDISPNGYTWLEEYLNGVDGDVVTIAAESVAVTPETATLNVPDTITLSKTFTPVNTSNQNGVWESSNESIATVSSDGTVTSIAEGEVTITFTSNDGGFSDSATITVTNIIIDVESITVTPNTLALDLGEVFQANVDFVPANATNKNGTWTSSNPSVASVDNNGNITGIGEGVATITFTSLDNASLTGDILVTVEDVFFGTYEFYNADTDGLIQLIEGDSSFDLNVIGDQVNLRVIPEGGDNNDFVESVKIEWSGMANGERIESNPVYSGLAGSANGDWEAYTIIEGTYNFTITYYSQDGASGDIAAIDTFSLTFFFDTTLVANAGSDQDICEGETITLTASGGTSYLWSTGETTNSIVVSPTATNTYSVTVSNDEGEQDTDEVIVTVNNMPIADAGEDQTICEGEFVTLTASGGTTYLWSTGETTASIEVNPSSDTTYSVEVSSNNCSSTDSVTVFVFSIPNLTVSDDIVIVDGQSTILTANGGTNYLWSTGETTASISVTPTVTTTYTVSSVGANDCSISADVTVTVIPEVIANAGTDTTICVGENVTLNATGGETYLWNTGETTPELIVSPSVTTIYTVTVEDAYGNTDTDSVTITVNETPDITVSGDVVIIDGESTTLTANGGDNYQWNTGEITASILVSPTVTTTYTVISTAPGGCADIEQVTVTVIPEVIADAGQDATICSGEAITLNASGGSIYLWNTGETTASITISPLVSTTYTVIVEDDYGFTDTDSVTITVNESPNISVSNDVTIMDGDSTTLIANGGDNYQWNTGETTASIVVSPSITTTYTVSSLGANNCEDVEDVTVTVIPELIANAGVDTAICNGDSITLNATGGIIFTWNTGETGSQLTVSPTVTTTYTVTVEDGLGNSDTDSVTITVNETPNVIVSENITIVEGESTDLNVSGAQTYQWSTGETASSITVSPSQTTTYTVIATANTCSIEAQVTVTVLSVFQASAGEDERVCQNDNNEVVLTANQGDSYLWNTGETTQSIIVNPLATSTYTVTVTQGSQEDTADVTVYVDPNPEVVILNGDTIEILNGEFVTLSASGANSYEWNNGATQPNIAVSPSVTTTYEVTGYIGDCSDDKQVTVKVIPKVIADAGEDVSICLSEVTTLSASGGDEYLWSTGETTQSIQVSPDVTTEYAVTVFNALDFDEDSVIVGVDVDCYGDPSDDSQDFDFDIFPNPASNFVNIRLSGSDILTHVYLYDMTGKLLQSTRISNESMSNSSNTKINIRGLQSGIYYIKLVDINQELTKKLIVK